MCKKRSIKIIHNNGAILHPWRKPCLPVLCGATAENQIVMCVFMPAGNQLNQMFRSAQVMQVIANGTSADSIESPSHIQRKRENPPQIWTCDWGTFAFGPYVYVQSQGHVCYGCAETRRIASVAARRGRNPKCEEQHSWGNKQSLILEQRSPITSLPNGSMSDIGRSWSGCVLGLPVWEGKITTNLSRLEE